MSRTTKNSTKRSPYDFYPTPHWVTEVLVENLDFGLGRGIPNPHATVIEPCIGEGHIANIIRPYFGKLDWCEIQKGKDFLTFEPDITYDFCITNPPFSLAKEFVDKSLEIADCVCMLMRVNMLGGQKRREWWKQKGLTNLWTLSKRPSYSNNGKTDATEYAWFIFDKTGRQTPTFDWLM